MHPEKSITLPESTQEKPDNIENLPYNVIRVPVQYLADIWSHVMSDVQRGLAVSDMSMGALIDGLLDQSIQLWLVLRSPAALVGRRAVIAVFCTSIERDVTPERGAEWVLSLYGLGGKQPRLWTGAVHAEMQRYARSEDCKRVRLCGRRAWQRILPGYAITGERPFQDERHYIYERAVDPT